MATPPRRSWVCCARSRRRWSSRALAWVTWSSSRSIWWAIRPKAASWTLPAFHKAMPSSSGRPGSPTRWRARQCRLPRWPIPGFLVEIEATAAKAPW